MKKFTFCCFTSAVFLSFADDHSDKLPVEADYYPITTIPLPEGEVIEVSGIDVLPGNKVAIASRRGDIFVGENVFGKNPNPLGPSLPAGFTRSWESHGRTDGFT